MDKRKLIQIIEKELEELKIITEEVSESEKDTGLIIEIALGKARVLCQEIELLQTFSAKENTIQSLEEDEDPDTNISDPELEITSQDEGGTDFTPEELEEDDALEEDLEEEDLADDEDLEEDIEDESEREGLIEFEPGTETTVEDNSETFENNIEKSEFQIEPQTDFREINIDDSDEELTSKKTSPAPNQERPVFREIPKPQELISDEKTRKETFQKGATLNDTIGENKITEPTVNIGPIASLKAAIGLNDRFLFIREIFGNDTDKYNEIIDHLDKLETIQQAVDYLKLHLTLKKNETSLKFVELLKRRFTK